MFDFIPRRLSGGISETRVDKDLQPPKEEKSRKAPLSHDQGRRKEKDGRRKPDSRNSRSPYKSSKYDKDQGRKRKRSNSRSPSREPEPYKRRQVDDKKKTLEQFFVRPKDGELKQQQ